MTSEARLLGEAGAILGIFILTYWFALTSIGNVEDKQFAAYATGVLAHLVTIIYVMVRTRVVQNG